MSLMDNASSPLLGRCKSCDYVIFATREDVKPAETFREVTAGTGVYKVGNNGFFARCSNRHKFFAVKGTYSPDHKCDARCLNAKGWSCTCSCGGANHGRGHVAAVVNAAELRTKLVENEIRRNPQNYAPSALDMVAQAAVREDPSLVKPAAGKHLGEVGKHIRGEVKIARRLEVANVRMLYKFITEAGDNIDWFVPAEYDPQWPEGKTLTIRAKVIRHESHERFGNSTVVIYVEEV